MFRDLKHIHAVHIAQLNALEEGLTTQTKLLAKPSDSSDEIGLISPKKINHFSCICLYFVVPMAVGVLSFGDLAATVTGLNDASSDEDPSKLIWLIDINPQNRKLITSLICLGYGIQLIYTYVPFVKDGFETFHELWHGQYPDDQEEWPLLSGQKEKWSRRLSFFVILPSIVINGFCCYYFVTDETGLNWPKLPGIVLSLVYTPAYLAVEGVNCLREIRLILGGTEHEYPVHLAPYAKYLKYLINIPSFVLAMGGSMIVLSENYTVLKDPDINTLNCPNPLLFSFSIIPSISYFFFERKINTMAFHAFIQEISCGINRLQVASFLLNVTSSLFIASALGGFMGTSLEEFDLFYLPKSVITGVKSVGITSLATGIVYMANELFDYAVTKFADGFRKIGSAFSSCRRHCCNKNKLAANPYTLFNAACNPAPASQSAQISPKTSLKT